MDGVFRPLRGESLPQKDGRAKADEGFAIGGKRISECDSVVFCGAAARLRRAAARYRGGGQPYGLAAAKTSLHSKGFWLQVVLARWANDQSL
jgi:hypothetical protein